ncbi:MAG TPA: type II toxin-antitoxin system Phd/YefM family antitoxin [Stellaceae bacterium]|nr:type II toxin-antitoxin system Phd/YefM family antitoxin [Stellaceae bacterium]
MPGAEWSLQDAKNSFSAVVVAASNGAPQTVTKRGKPAVVVLSVAEYERLTHAEVQRRPSFVEHLLAMPKGPLRLKPTKLKLRDVKF